jgi:hypothetical protein
MRVPKLLAIPIIMLALMACTTKTHDTVVGVVPHCQIRNTSTANGGVTHSYQDVTGIQCTTPSYLELTIRTGGDKTYAAKVPAGAVVHVGDPWPPE